MTPQSSAQPQSHARKAWCGVCYYAAVLNPGLISAINEALNEDGKDVVIKEGIDFGFTESSPSSVDIVVPEGRTLHVNGEVSASGIIIVDGGTINNHGGALTITTLTIKDGGTHTNNRRRGYRTLTKPRSRTMAESARTSVESAKHVKMCRGHDGFLLLGSGDGDSDGTPKAS